MLAELRELGVGLSNPFVGWTRHHAGPTLLEVEMHPGFEVGVVLSGQVERRCEGFVSLLGPGEVWLNAAWEPHGWRITGPGTQQSVFLFAPEFISDQIFESPWYLSLFSAPPRHRPRVQGKAMRQEMLAIGRGMTREVEEKRHGWRSAAQLGLLRLLHTLGRDWEPRHPTRAARRAPAGAFARIMPAVNLVYSRSEVARRVALAEAAAACSLSVSQFRFVFLQTMGLTFGRFCMRARLAFASHLLLTTDLSVDGAARRAGFTDASHLHRAFVKHYGCTPARYRELGMRLPETADLAS